MHQSIEDRELGSFTYDDTLWEMVHVGPDIKYLHWIGSNRLCTPPKGLRSYAKMFLRCELGEGFEFDASNMKGVESLEGMFMWCKLPEGFTLHNFDTEDVTDMEAMFCCCELPSSFSLGNLFNTVNVTNMKYMFQECVMHEEFSLGRLFNTKNVQSMNSMFKGCIFPKGFNLGRLFDMSSVVSVKSMFEGAKIQAVFSFGNKFDTANVEDVSCMFKDCDMSDEVYPEFKLYVSKSADRTDMFSGCVVKNRNGEASVVSITDYSDYLDIATIGVPIESSYDCRRLVDVPLATLGQCHTKDELWEVVMKYCKI